MSGTSSLPLAVHGMTVRSGHALHRNLPVLTRPVGEEGECARKLARHCVSQWLDLEPNQVVIARDASGRPYVDHPQAPGVSISHSNGHVAVLVAHGVVGVDIEHVRAVRSPFAVADAAWPPSLSRVLRSGACDFFSLWTMAEAIGKALGKGLHGLRHRDIRYVQADGRPSLQFGRLRAWNLPTWPGFAAALCSEVEDGRCLPDASFIEHPPGVAGALGR